MSEPSKPCPFCGDSAFLRQTIDDDWYVSCRNDECKGNVGYFYTAEEALFAWDHRQPFSVNVNSRDAR